MNANNKPKSVADFLEIIKGTDESERERERQYIRDLDDRFKNYPDPEAGWWQNRPVGMFLLGVGIIWGITILLSILAHFALDFFPLGMSLGLALWVAGFRMIPAASWRIVERLGVPYRVAKPGPTVIIPGVDTLLPAISQKVDKQEMYQDEGDHSLDFLDASSPIVARIWYRVVNPIRWQYGVDAPRSRMEDRFDSLARPLLQAFTLDAAQVHKTNASKAITRHLQPAIRGIMGAEVDQMLITDIQIPDEVKALRNLALEGEKLALREKRVGGGYSQAIKTIMEDLGCNRETAERIYMTREGYEALKEVKGGVTLYGTGIDGAIRSMGFGEGKGGNQ